MNKRVMNALLGVVCVGGLSLSACTTTKDPSATATTKSNYVCSSERVTGSRISHSRCRSDDEVDAQRQGSQAMLDRQARTQL